MTELQWLTASEIGAAYAARRLSPVELVRALLREIAARNPDCGAFIRVDAEGALETARRAETDIFAGRSLGPLHGIPLGAKDNIDIAGVATTCHSKILLDNIAPNDAPAIANLRAAGAIMLGKQSLHEFAFGGPSKELPFPFARHPWNTDYHPGGSSSGSGVALAAGFVPLSLGTDAGGSIRNPAGNCGVVGLKPTYDLVSRRGVFPVAFTLDHVGPMARSVADVALFLDGLVGSNTEGKFGADLERGVRGLRIGFVRQWHETDMVADPEVMAALDEVERVLRQDGAEVRTIALPRAARAGRGPTHHSPGRNLGRARQMAARAAAGLQHAVPPQGHAGRVPVRRRLRAGPAMARPDDRRGRRCVPRRRRAAHRERHGSAVPDRRWSGPRENLSPPGPQPLQSHRASGDCDAERHFEDVRVAAIGAVRRTCL